MKCRKKNNKIPLFLEVSEFVFLINLIRIATKENIIPLKITLQNSINDKELDSTEIDRRKNNISKAIKSYT